jgi:hypothetical protein
MKAIVTHFARFAEISSNNRKSKDLKWEKKGNRTYDEGAFSDGVSVERRRAPHSAPATALLFCLACSACLHPSSLPLGCVDNKKQKN